jgi:hypothetical protein
VKFFAAKAAMQKRLEADPAYGAAAAALTEGERQVAVLSGTNSPVET